jgi:hypothetical protein
MLKPLVIKFFYLNVFSIVWLTCSILFPRKFSSVTSYFLGPIFSIISDAMSESALMLHTHKHRSLNLRPEWLSWMVFCRSSQFLQENSGQCLKIVYNNYFSHPYYSIIKIILSFNDIYDYPVSFSSFKQRQRSKSTVQMLEGSKITA